VVLKYSFLFLKLFLLFFPISVTLSQSFAILSFSLFIYHSYTENKQQNLYTEIFIISILLYISLVPSILIHIFSYDSFFKQITKSEISDFWMCFIILPAYYFYKDESKKKELEKTLFISSLILFSTGFISLFTPFRLGKYISSGFKVIDGDRLQHYAGNFFGIDTYLPLGMMNTHLTYGGLLGLVTPFFWTYILKNFYTSRILKKFFFLILSFISILIILFNQSRSVWFGLLFCLFFILLRGKFYKNKKVLISISFILLSISLVGVFLYSKNWMLQRAFGEAFKHSTENQRYFIYKNTVELIKRNPFLGVGAGRFENEHFEESKGLIKENEQLWYELEITPRQHAHHDLLHFFAIGGILSFSLYLYFWFYIYLYFYIFKLKDTFPFLGLQVLFFSGLFQSYFLDDEFILPFYAILGFFFSNHKISKTHTRIRYEDTFQEESLHLKNYIVYLFDKLKFKEYNFRRISFLLLPLLFSLVSILIIINKSPDEVYKRKVKTNNPELKKLIYDSLSQKLVTYPTQKMAKKEDAFMIEGCLTHYFSNSILIRKDPFRFRVHIPFHSKNPPTYVSIDVYSRDSFDQDKLYKVHQSKLIKENLIFGIYPGENYIEIDDIYSNLESKKFPENIFFRDFSFFFGGFDSTQEYFDLPKIEFIKNCK
jgi:O-antigen ligase